MYKQCTTEETVLRQQQIEACLMENMRKHAFQEISVSDLCKQMGISRNLFYRYYSSKEDVLLGMIDHALMDYGRYTLPPQEDVAPRETEVVRFFSYWKEQVPLLDALRRNDLQLRFLERVVYHANTEEPGILDKMVPFLPNCGEERMLFLVSGVITLMLNWHRKDFDKSVSEMAKIVIQMLTAPFFQI